MSVAIEITAEGLEEAIAAIAAYENLDKRELLEGVGALVESQTKRRIMSEKQSPGGEAWPDNNADNPVMVLSGALHDSIAFQVDGEAIFVGSSLVYAAQRHFGGVIKAKNAEKLAFTINGQTVFVDQVEQPAREFLGISADNASEIEQAVVAFLEQVAP
ncbi:MAG: phage virion morphogenesis protein [Roseitalea sp.]|nr:phage virion morphogenesis protein [Roseitalea sp.]MBO6950986.1 phage virion morphogenesis protein [Rhizobiaceae bacterium]MBO6591027.1 phage virion morphogenesis protein [Roseitalea sp.]MBO6599715.1 phage virion morphogenesis protein [Roseitalea sp.]MBO6611471.1 phage virion morphogenesis protein [Roseitalea sp.]